MRFPLSRQGMTLIEIMMSVMILGLGLLGILSVIPFIEFHSARVVESDFTAATGTNAITVIRSHGWEKPAMWDVYKDYLLNEYPENMVRDNFVFPRFFDRFGERDIQLDSTSAIPLVYPNLDLGVHDDDYRGQDDIVVERDENSSLRPQLMLNETGPEFTGTYSWAALMTPSTSDLDQDYTKLEFPPVKDLKSTKKIKDIDDQQPTADLEMKVDVLVFRSRDANDANDWIVGELIRREAYERGGIEGNGYLGGRVNIVPTINAASEVARMAEFEKSLGSSTHILLIGPCDRMPENTNAAYFSAWYKINNFHRQKADDGTSFFTLTLSGPSTPTCWLDVQSSPFKNDRGSQPTTLNLNPQSGNVRAILFRNLRGIFTQTIPISGSE